MGRLDGRLQQCKECGNWFDLNKQTVYAVHEEGGYACEKCARELPEFQGWGIFTDEPKEWHIRPINEPEHVHDKNICKCSPKKTIREDGIVVYTHFSFDGREAVEEARRILNP
jgi:hypothetical protein